MGIDGLNNTYIIPPVKKVGESTYAIPLGNNKKFILIPVPQYSIDDFLFISHEKIVANPQLLVDYTYAMIERFFINKKKPVVHITANQGYLEAKLLIPDLLGAKPDYLRVETALALAGRGKWPIFVQESLLVKKTKDPLHRNVLAIENMVKFNQNLPNDFVEINVFMGWSNLQ